MQKEGVESVDLIGHSLGGIAAIEFLQLKKKGEFSDITVQVDKIIAIAVPFFGSPMAYLTPDAWVLRRESEKLEEVRDFLARHPGISPYCIAGEQDATAPIDQALSMARDVSRKYSLADAQHASVPYSFRTAERIKAYLRENIEAIPSARIASLAINIEEVFDNFPAATPPPSLQEDSASSTSPVGEEFVSLDGRTTNLLSTPSGTRSVSHILRSDGSAASEPLYATQSRSQEDVHDGAMMRCDSDVAITDLQEEKVRERSNSEIVGNLEEPVVCSEYFVPVQTAHSGG
jgi:hypothetical protein